MTAATESRSRSRRLMSVAGTIQLSNRTTSVHSRPSYLTMQSSGFSRSRPRTGGMRRNRSFNRCPFTLCNDDDDIVVVLADRLKGLHYILTAQQSQSKETLRLRLARLRSNDDIPQLENEVMVFVLLIARKEIIWRRLPTAMPLEHQVGY